MTPWGPLEGEDLKTAEVLYLYWYDKVNDSGKYKLPQRHAGKGDLQADDHDNYRDARSLWADPLFYYNQKSKA